VVAGWTSYKEFRFSGESAEISASDKTKVAEIADYIKNNPSLEVGIDGYRSRANRGLNNRRINAVRDSLVTSGIPADRIKTGEFGNPELRTDGRVEVLFRTK
jgi:outer membrane protein OmpA-like peptidoglycan-associated protein